MNKLFFKVWRHKYICSIIFYYLNLYKTYRNCYIKDLTHFKTYQWKDYVNKIVIKNEGSLCVNIKKCYFSNQENIKSIHFFSTNLEIEENSIPNSITDLVIGNILINEKTTPPMDIIKSFCKIYTYKNLKSLKIISNERKINLLMNESNQFEGLTNLNLNFNLCRIFLISKLSLPKNLKSLTLDYFKMTNELNEDIILPTLTYLKIITLAGLKIKSLYNTNIKDMIIENCLKTRLPSSINILPKNLSKLYLGVKITDLFSTILGEFLPEGIRVYCTRRYPVFVLPKSLKYLKYLDHDNLPIVQNDIIYGMKSIFPKKLKYLYVFGSHFDQSLKLLPSSITHLEIQSSHFNQSFNFEGCLPSNLISLKLSYEYFWKLKISNQKSKNTKAKPLQFTHCPKSLKIIKFSNPGNRKSNCTIITFSQLQRYINEFNFLSLDKLKSLDFLQMANLIYYN